MVDIKRISDWKLAEKYQDQWNNLVMQNEKDEHFNSTIYQTYEWNQLWWQSFSSPDDELLLLFAFDGTTLVGIAPLMITTRKSLFNKKIVHFIGTNNTLLSSDFCSFIAYTNRQDIVQSFLKWLDNNHTTWDQLELYNVPESSNDFQSLTDAFPHRIHRMDHKEAPSRVLHNQEDYAALVKTFYTHNANNKFNGLKKQGEISYEYYRSPEDIKNKLADFFNLHIERRALTPYPSNFQYEEHREFYKNMIELMSPKGWIILMTLNINGQPISYQFCFEFNGKLYFYTPSFNVNYKKYSVGYIHIVQIFEYILQNKYKEASFGAGGEEYKYRFANKITKIVSVLIFNKQSTYMAYKTKLSCVNAIKTVVRPIRNLLVKGTKRE